jgi:hypothetical protein
MKSGKSFRLNIAARALSPVRGELFQTEGGRTYAPPAVLTVRFLPVTVKRGNKEALCAIPVHEGTAFYDP